MTQEMNGMEKLWMVIMFIGAISASAVEVPYAARPDGQMTRYPLVKNGEAVGTAALGWTKEALVIEVQVRDGTPISLSDVGVGIAEAYHADSVEFWVGKRQFVAAATKEGGLLWDYIYQQPVARARVVFKSTDDGYRLRVEMPWAALGLTAKTGLNFPFLLQINDRQRVKDGERWKESGRQLVFPETATWDRVSTYGMVFLAEDAVAGSAPEPLPFAALDIRAFAYEKKAEAVVCPLTPFAQAEFLLVCRDPDGKSAVEIPVPKLLPPAISNPQPANPAAKPSLLLPLPWDESRAGIFQAELYLIHDGQRYGPVSEPFFNAGKTPIANYHSDRKAPADLAEFWEKKIAAMRARPMRAEVTEVKSERPGVVVEKVRLDNHRGAPMVVWVTRRQNEEGPRPARLNVYPPMRAVGPAWPQPGSLGLTFCGSRQGECRLPEQTRDEGLWARAETLDESYWLDVVLDGVRAMDYVASRPDSNGRTIVSGGSRGGWYSLALAAVAPDRVALARFGSPCYSDVTLNQQLGNGSAATEIRIAFERDRVQTGGKVFQNFRYFDPLFLAELIRTPVVFSAGLQDGICSAIGMTAAANRMPKEFCTFVLDPEGGHGGSPWMGAINQTREKLTMQPE
jgi:cephalosporin-C deacetylase-like acetyl esterase